MTYDFETDPRYEPYLNYSLGVFAAGCALISTLLNPLILFVYTRKEKTIKNFLFKLIAVSDFLTNLLPATFISYVFLSSVKFEQYTFLNQVPEFFCCTFGCISQVTVALMAITRMVKFIRPFYTIKFKWVLTYLVVYAVYMVVGNAGFLICAGMRDAQQNDEIFEHTTSEKWIKYSCITMNLLHCFVGIVCSFITVGYLWIEMKRNGHQYTRWNWRGSNTILIMNIPYLISIVINFLVLRQNIGKNIDLVNHYVIPIFTSAFNPCVIVARTEAVKVLARSIIRKARVPELRLDTLPLSEIPLSDPMSV